MNSTAGFWSRSLVYSRAYDFDCGDADLNEFFRKDLIPHELELLTKSYALTPQEARVKDGFVPVALVSFSNDSIRLKDIEDSVDLPEPKRYPNLPAVKIARLGVHSRYQSNEVGTLLLNMVKKFFLMGNRTGCRIITVDVYNDPRVIRFYEKSYFSFVTQKDKNRNSRAMFYDLKRTLGGELDDKSQI